MRRYFVDKTCINLIRLVLLLLTALQDGLFYYCIPAVPYLSDLPAIMWTVIGLVTAAGLFAAMVYLPLYFRHTCYYISSEQVIKHSGCFFVRTQTLRRSAIQYTTAISTPFSKITGLNFLMLSAFGGSMLLLFLSKRDFDQLRTALQPPRG